jgi:peptide chain release factor subunit 3
VEVDETRQPASLVFIGHVDAGKSTIAGNLMFNMGVVDQRTIAKYKEEAKSKGRDSWWLAYVMDINEEEKAKGKTVEVGRACFDLPSKRMTIFDAPGHKNYVPNMIQGAALADYGALVISAKRGEFESGFDLDGQTREHIQLAKSLGIVKLVVVVNKMDESTVKWSKERYDEIKTQLSPFIKECGYDVEKDISWVPVSGLNGDNLKDPLPKNVCNWYSGPPLIDLIDQLGLPERDPNGPIRIPVLDKMKDRGVVMFGKIEQGTVT